MSRHPLLSVVPLLCLATWAIAPPLLFAQQPKKPAPRPAPKAPAAKPAAPKPDAPKPAPPPPDLVVTTAYATGDTRTKSTISLKAARQRIDYGNGLAAILQCDTGNRFQVNDTTRTFLPITDDAPPPPRQAGAKSKGGQITYTTTTTDTGETKTLFGFPARHLKTVVTKEADAGACDKKLERVETDGWFLDLPATMSCAAPPKSAPSVRVDAQQSDCSDEVHFTNASTVVVGYPASYSIVASTADGGSITTAVEVTDVKHVELPPATFEIASDYLEVKSVAQLTADHRPGEFGAKKPGIVRLGVAPLVNKTQSQLATRDLTQALSESLSESQLEIVLLAGATPAELVADAKAKECDFILQNTVSELKKPGKSLLGKISGSSGDAFSAKVDYAFMPPGLSAPTFASSGRSGESTLQTAVGAAKRVVQFAPPFMMARYGFMNSYSTMMGGGASAGAMQQSPDPVLNSMFSLLDHATKKPTESSTSEEGAVAIAMEREVATVIAELSKPKR